MLRASRVSKSRSPYSRTTTTNSAARAKKRSVPETTLPRPHDVAIVDQAPIVTQSQTVSTVASLVPLQPASSAEVNQVDQVSSIGSLGRPLSLHGTYSVLESYSGTVASLLQASVSQNTANVYRQGLQSFFNFRQQLSFQQIWPPPVDHMINFIAYLSESNMAFSTVKCYLSGISFVINLHGWQNPVDSFIIKKLLAGYKRCNPSQDIRKPITLPLLNSIVSVLPHLCFSDFEAALFQSAFALAFFALLRVSEVVALGVQHITVSSDIIEIFIKTSKTDQIGAGAFVHVKKSNDTNLLFQSLQKFAALSTNVKRVSYFSHLNSKPLTEYQFSSMLNKALQFLNIQSTQFKTHSFRIGGATHLYTKGFSEDHIKQMGRWQSAAYKSLDSIWIIGSSIIHWAHIYAKNSNQENLGQESSNILWHGIRGMVWEQLYPTIEFLLARNKKPKIIIIHCGGNNIGQAHNTLRGLQKYYKSTLANIANLLPQTFIIWSHILPRNNWINCLANTEGQNCRRRINSACATFVLNKFQGRGASVSYPDIRAQCKELFRKDGVHLSDLGNSIFINTLRNALDHFIGCNFVSSTFP
ncbi:uncharacterized protein LOC134281609 [Saccostrea cucullata]|uniref:uncharacterized protein LOC134281609 n=2 Tax=Saccostrea cuccullata TaxID=36930 RepID=UPI002ED60CA0